jgi:hypothetical protein
MYNPGGTNSVVFAHVTPNGIDISSSAPGTIFYGDAYGGTVGTSNILVPIGTTDPHDSGGIVCIHPFLFSFGNFGTLNWSAPADPLSVGTSNARITEQKMVAGLSTRGGSGASPAGLFWSLNSLIRMTFVGGSAQFSFDTVSDNINILSSKSPVEYDGTFYWVGAGRFLRYNGVIDENANDVNVDDFFSNLNMAYAQRMWGCAVPQWGEIWWFYPRGTNTECTHAVIYNKRLSERFGRPVWYDTELPFGGFRTAGVRPRVFPYPVWASNPNPLHPSGTGTGSFGIFQHEIGTDLVANGLVLPIYSSVTSTNISTSIGQPDSNVRLTRVEPDFRQVGELLMERRARAYARSKLGIRTAVFQPGTKKIDDLRGQGRELTLKVSSNAPGGHYEFGQVLIHIEPGDVRPVESGGPDDDESVAPP